MQTRALRTLTRIDQLGSFAETAAQLNMTLSAVSSQIKTLEAELDAELFDRSHRPPKLTPLGRIVCDRAREVLEREAALVAACHRDGGLTGRFRIGFVATASIRLLPDFLVQAQRLAQQAQFDIETGVSAALQDRVASGQLDAAVVTASEKPPAGLTYAILRREPLVFIRPATAPTTLPALFASLPFYHFQPNSGIGKLIADRVAPHMQTGGRATYLDSVEAIMECVNRGLGFTLLPEPDARRRLGPGAEIGPGTGDTLHRELVLVTSARKPTGDTAALVDLFQTTIRNPEDAPRP